MSKRGLGRGFDSLIPTEVTADMPDSVQPAARDVVLQISPTSIAPNPHQPRTQFDQAELEGLAASIREHGILQPLVASKAGEGRFELIAGERRLRAAKLAGLATVPVIVRSFDKQQKMELALLENVQRSQLNPIETAAGYRKLVDEFNLSLDDIASRMGKAKSTVANVMRLLALPVEARQAVANGHISEAHGRAILAVNEPERQQELLRLITENNWTVRQAEEYARVSKTHPEPKSHARSASTGGTSNPLTVELEDFLGTKVSMQSTAKGGKLIIEYYSDEELQRIVDTIKPTD